MSEGKLGPLPEDFLDRWDAQFRDVPPVGFLLREAEPDRWLRIHSLHGSRRYPSSDGDWVELLRRHNAVATDLLGEGAPCAVVVFHACDVEKSSGLGVRTGLTQAELPRIGKLPSELWDADHGVFVEPVCLFGGAVTWRSGAFDAFVSAVADNQVCGLIAAVDTGAVYAPYDGGADLFFPSTWERDAARSRYRQWLSEHPEGL